MSDDEMEDYGFEYSDEEQDEEAVDIENCYYNAKGLKDNDDPREAIDGFNQVVSMEESPGEWGFKALKQLVKLYHSSNRTEKMLESYTKLLSFESSSVTKNAYEKKVNSLLDYMGQQQSGDAEVLQRFYETTLTALEKAKNERLLFKTNMKLAGLWFKKSNFSRLSKILSQLHTSCLTESGMEDPKKGTQLLDIYALEIQMYTEQKDKNRLRQLYQKALSVKSAIPHPRILGIVRECGGKMHMNDKNWVTAATDFFEAFKAFDEAGNPRRVQCLKYLVLASMLMESKVDPFDAQEARPYKKDPEVQAMTNLVDAYQRSDITEFEKILRNNKRTIMDDPFIRDYIEDLLSKIRTAVVIKLIQPYTRVRIAFLSHKLNIPALDVEQLLINLILDKRISGSIDQVNQVLEVGSESQIASDQSEDEGGKKYEALAKWSMQLETLHSAVLNKLVI